MRAILFLLASWSLAAQTPPPAPPAPAFDEAFFSGDRRAILEACADRTRLLKPDDATFQAECGRAYLAALDRSKAEAAFRIAEQREPKDGQVLRLIAHAWLKEGYKTEALETYEKILARDPKNKDALAAAATDLAEVGLEAEADRFMQAYALRESDDWKRFIEFGRAFLISGRRKKAAAWFARAVALKPHEEKVYLELAQAFADVQSVM
ncbi:MAG TPA: hypothetical protein VF768_10450 [Holophagaceae bacterium]